MKKTILLLLFFGFISFIYSQNNNNNNLDLRKLFRDKVNEIKLQNNKNLRTKKNFLETLPSTAKVVKKSASVQNSPVKPYYKKVIKKSKSSKNSIKSIYIKIFILFESSLLAAIVVIYRRKKLGFKKALRKELKQNIGLLRKEQLKSESADDLVNVRKSLTRKKIKVQNGTSSITKLAKKLSIAKGEVHLAVKLNMIAGE